MKTATRFTFPVGPRGGIVWKSYYRAARLVDLAYWRDNKDWHPGEDWNRIIPPGGNPDIDLGDPVYASANGIVESVGHWPVWGNIIVIRHLLPSGATVWSQYAHLNTVDVSEGDSVAIDQEIGTIGKGDKPYPAHLHFEIRKIWLKPNAWEPRVSNRSAVLEAYYNPTDFIEAHKDEFMPFNPAVKLQEMKAEFLKTGKFVNWGPDPDSCETCRPIGLQTLDIAEGQTAGQAVGIYQLSSEENGGNHNVYFTVVDDNWNRIPGARVMHLWEGASRPPLRTPDDKPWPNESGNFPLNRNEFVWVKADMGYDSDTINTISFYWPPLGSGATVGHHSFYVVFRIGPYIKNGVQPPKPEPPKPIPPNPGALDGKLIQSTLRVIDDNADRTRFEITQVLDVKKK